MNKEQRYIDGYYLQKGEQKVLTKQEKSFVTYILEREDGLFWNEDIQCWHYRLPTFYTKRIFAEDEIKRIQEEIRPLKILIKKIKMEGLLEQRNIKK